jgi:hypothetical protein
MVLDENHIRRVLNVYSNLYSRKHPEEQRLDYDAFRVAVEMCVGDVELGQTGSAGRRFLLLYEFTPHYLQVDNALLFERLRYASASIGRGELQLSGSCLGEEPLEGVLVFRALNRKTVEEFAENDPYVMAKLVTKWRVKDWAIDVGAFGYM